MMNWISKTRVVKCPDGTEKFIYKDVNHAFPLMLKTSKNKLSAELKIHKENIAKLSSDYASKVDGILYQISEKNESLMMDFRCAYLGLQTDPCNDNGYFNRQVNKLQQQRHDLALLSIKVNTLITLVKENKSNPAIANLFNEIVNNLAGTEYVEQAVQEIHANGVNAKKWRGENNG